MGYGILGAIWRTLTPGMRQRVVRLTQPRFTVSAAAVVLNSDRKVLLLDHVMRPAGGWGLPGGFLDVDEDPQVAVRRELMEEVGVELNNVSLLKISTHRKHIEILFSATTECHGEVKSPSEIKTLGWFSPDALPDEVPPAQRAIINVVFARDV